LDWGWSDARSAFAELSAIFEFAAKIRLLSKRRQINSARVCARMATLLQ
jgi:hypothetical protein